MIGRVPFLENETHGIVTSAAMHQRVSSDTHRWSSLYASAQVESPFQGEFKPVKDQLLVLHRSGPARLETHENGRIRMHEARKGQVHLHPGGAPFNVRLLDPLDTMHVYIRQSVIAEVAAELFDADIDRLEIPSQIMPDDAIMVSMLETVHSALFEGDVSTSIYIDYLSRAIAVHLLRKYSGQMLKELPQTVGLSADVSKALDYMRANLSNAISLSNVSDALGRSPSYLGRQFRIQLGKAPHAYLIDMRLETAKNMLENTNEQIAAIAVDCGFTHQEHMTRLFKRRYKTTPAVWRKTSRH